MAFTQKFTGNPTRFNSGEKRAQLVLQRFLRRRFSRSLQPIFEIGDAHAVRHFRILDGDGNCPIAANAIDPIMRAEDMQSPADRLVEAVRHLDAGRVSAGDLTCTKFTLKVSIPSGLS